MCIYIYAYVLCYIYILSIYICFLYYVYIYILMYIYIRMYIRMYIIYIFVYYIIYILLYIYHIYIIINIIYIYIMYLVLSWCYPCVVFAEGACIRSGKETRWNREQVPTNSTNTHFMGMSHGSKDSKSKTHLQHLGNEHLCWLESLELWFHSISDALYKNVQTEAGATNQKCTLPPSLFRWASPFATDIDRLLNIWPKKVKVKTSYCWAANHSLPTTLSEANKT